MRERAFNARRHEVLGILSGRQTQTRRVVKPQPKVTEKRLRELGAWAEGLTLSQQVNAAFQSGCIEATCPYGQRGDRLWVRESFQPILTDGKEHGERGINYRTGEGYEIVYAATDQVVEWVNQDGDVSSACKPSIHMPRWASRITLEITGVRVERLQDISEKDAEAEGCPLDRLLARDWYIQLWESINGPGAWAENPWVWVVEFKQAAQQGETQQEGEG